MGSFRFRKRLRIVPGMWVNLSAQPSSAVRRALQIR
jgi:hypothetical protein